MYNGAAGIDMKRPYGNKDIYTDIAETLGWDLFETMDDEKVLSKSQGELAIKLHQELETALQIVLCTQSFVSGLYRMTGYDSLSWKLVDPGKSQEPKPSDLDVAKVALKKYFGRFHEIQSGEYTYLQPYKLGDIEGHLYVEGHGLTRIIHPEQLSDFMEFRLGELVSY